MLDVRKKLGGERSMPRSGLARPREVRALSSWESGVAVCPSGGRGVQPPKIVEFCTAKCLEITAISGVSRHIFPS